MSQLRQVLNSLGIIKEAIKLPLSNPNLILSIIFFLLFPFNLILLAVNSLHLRPSFELRRETQVISEIVLARDILHWLAGTLSVAIISKAYINKPPSISQLLSSFQRQWVKIFVTSMFAELIAFNCQAFLLVLGYPPKATGLAAFITSMAGFCVFMFVHLACQMSIVVSAVEESSYGLVALRMAVGIINGRKVQSFVLMALMFLMEALVTVVPIGLVFQLFRCSVFCVIYLDSKKRTMAGNDELNRIM